MVMITYVARIFYFFIPKFVIMDDLLATGGTAKCKIDMLRKEKEILALSVVIELSELDGAILGIPVYSEVKF